MNFQIQKLFINEKIIKNKIIRNYYIIISSKIKIYNYLMYMIIV